MNSEDDAGWDAVEDALRHDDPASALRELVRGMLDAGVERDEAYRGMKDWRLRLRKQGRQTDEDVVLEVMDFLVGWSGPEAKL